MIIGHGNVQGRPALAHSSYARYLALLDVLGMKAWLEKDSARSIAEVLDVALVACGQSSCGTTAEGITYGPIIEVIHFSDSIIVWSPDDSWASLGALCSSLKMIVGVALTHGVPLRGSIAHGDVVCNQRTLKFVGQPIAEAYLWAEKQRPFKSVGVDLTPQTISKLAVRLANEPIPSHWRSSFSEAVIRRELEGHEDLIWHADCLFINHWAHGMFLRRDPAAMFLERKLSIPADQEAAVQSKLRELQEFHAKHQRLQSCQLAELLDRTDHGQRFDRTIEDFKLQQRDYVQLDGLRKFRAQ
jgi:hypothetical protein